jgi:alpha-tubulin suppressor-like RCC1 family protein
VTQTPQNTPNAPVANPGMTEQQSRGTAYSPVNSWRPSPGYRPPVKPSAQPFPDGATRVNAAMLAAGGYHSLQVKFDGTVWVTGWNSDGQMGNGTFNNLSLPQQVLANNYNSAPLMNVKSVAGGFAFSMVLLHDGTLRTWGDDASGQLGNGAPNADSSLPVTVPALTNVSVIAAGSNHCAVVRGDRTIWTWGG